MGSWKRTITSPFRKACTILSPQHQQGGSSQELHPQHGGDGGGNKRTKARRHGQLKGRPAMSSHGGGCGDGGVVEIRPTPTQLYGDVMACAYEDVQVMWSMLDNKARVLDATS